jgi:hypothetical protein
LERAPGPAGHAAGFVVGGVDAKGAPMLLAEGDLVLALLVDPFMTPPK